MKLLLKARMVFVLTGLLFAGCLHVSAQDSTAAEPSVNLRYFATNNSLQYLLVQTRLKVGRKFQPMPHRKFEVYMDTNKAENLIAKSTTNEKGEATVFIPPALKAAWNNGAKHSFIALAEGPPSEAELSATLDITRTRISLDTANTEDGRAINIKLEYLEGSQWLPAKDVEMKVGVARLASILPAGDEASYTTDSAGTASIEFKKLGLPGDRKGNLMLAAKVEDNEQYGNLLVEQQVPWGVAVTPVGHFFDQRTLWSTRFRTPFWLLFMAYSMAIGVWGAIIYLIFQIIRIKKLGAAV